METNNKAITGFAILFTNIMYIVLILILIPYVLEESYSNYVSELIIFGMIVVVSLGVSIPYLLKALRLDYTQDQIIVRLAIYHIPTLIGLLYVITSLFVL